MIFWTGEKHRELNAARRSMNWGWNGYTMEKQHVDVEHEKGHENRSYCGTLRFIAVYWLREQ